MAYAAQNMDGFGGLHIIIEDWNLEDSHIEYCEQDAETTPHEHQFLDALKLLTLDERYAMMALADSMWGVEPWPRRSQH